MARTTSINVRMLPDERKRLERLADLAGLTPSEAMRQVLRYVDRIEPVIVAFNDNGAGVTRKDAPRAVVA